MEDIKLAALMMSELTPEDVCEDDVDILWQDLELSFNPYTATLRVSIVAVTCLNLTR